MENSGTIYVIPPTVTPSTPLEELRSFGVSFKPTTVTHVYHSSSPSLGHAVLSGVAAGLASNAVHSGYNYNNYGYNNYNYNNNNGPHEKLSTGAWIGIGVGAFAVLVCLAAIGNKSDEGEHVVVHHY